MSAHIKHGTIVVPGVRLQVADKTHVAGQGTRVGRRGDASYIFSELAGLVKTETNDDGVEKISVVSPKTPGILPTAGDIVTAMVTVVNSRAVQCVIKCVGAQLLARSYRGVIKKEYIRETEKDRVDPYKSFKPGDVILARVMPITEVHWYHLTTAENELGVVIATAEGNPEGDNMIPLSWTEMQCPKTLVKEPRKVARVMPENINDALLPVESDVKVL